MAPVDLPALVLRQRSPIGTTVRLFAVGDTAFSGRAGTTARRRGVDSLLEDVAPVLRTGDVVFANLETTLVPSAGPAGMFTSPITSAGALRRAGFTVVSLANNHIGDYGQAGLAGTLCAIEETKLKAVGAGPDSTAARRLLTLDIHGVRIGWLACGRTLAPQDGSGPHYWEFDEDQLTTAVRQARQHIDVLIVSIHIGLMLLDLPDPNQKAMANRLMHSGADLILMHHPHVLQGLETDEHGRVCCYSLGNFVWDYLEGNIRTTVMLAEQQQGAVFLIELDKEGVARVVAVPTWIDAECCVRWARGALGRQILERLERLSVALAANYGSEFDRQRLERNLHHIVRYLWFHFRRGHWSVVIDQLRRMNVEHLNQAARYGSVWVKDRVRRAWCV
jgi:hypothetical protein